MPKPKVPVSKTGGSGFSQSLPWRARDARNGRRNGWRDRGGCRDAYPELRSCGERPENGARRVRRSFKRWRTWGIDFGRETAQTSSWMGGGRGYTDAGGRNRRTAAGDGRSSGGGEGGFGG